MAVGKKRKSRGACEPDQRDILHEVSTPGKKLRKLDKNFSNEEETLCERCSAINLDEAFQLNLTKRTAWKKEGQFVCSLGQLDTLSAATRCSLCQFWARMRLPLNPRRQTANENPKDLHYTLRAFPASKIWLGLKDKLEDAIDSALLAVLPSDPRNNSPVRVPWRCWNRVGESSFIYSVSLAETDDVNQIAGRVVQPSTVDFKSVRGWITFCKKHHKSDCAPVGVTNLSGLKMIDCLALEVVAAPRACEYVALSYVWGTPNEQKGPRSNQLSAAPTVILDAITVTTSLGFRYLWVDRYCISQDNMEEKHAQIGKMDIIYGGAQITIIAATGEDATYGLPGVGTRTRSPPPSIMVGSQLLSAIPPSPKYEIAYSKWSTRGWTFQEGLLSRRRLAFTRTQVYFQCGAMYCLESLRSPFELLRPTYEGNLELGVAFPPGRVGTGAYDMVQRIYEYNKRSLSYQSDGLNAILGVLHAFETEPDPKFHLWGIPLVTPGYFGLQNPPELEWIYALCGGLNWHTSRPVKRRSCFPSFSWVGWEIGHSGLAIQSYRTWINESLISAHQFKVIPIGIQLEMKDGTLVSWINLRDSNHISEAISTVSFLLVQSWSFSCCVSPPSNLTIHGHALGLHECAYAEIARKIRYFPTPKERTIALVKGSVPSGVCRAIVTDCFEAQTVEGGFVLELHCLIVQRHSSWYERVGMAFIHFGNLSHQLVVLEDGTGLAGGIVLRKDEFRLG